LSVVPQFLEPVQSDAARLDADGSDRRIHTRHSLFDLTWLDEARLKYGPSVALIDLSSGGAQIEIATHRLQPGTTVVFELSGRNQTLTVPANVLRAHVTGIRPHTTYRAALEFKRAFDLQMNPQASGGEENINLVHEHARLTLALRRRYDSAGGAHRVADPGDADAATSAALAIAQARSSPGADNPLANQLGRLMRVLTNGIASGASPQTVVGHVAECLKRAVPTRAVKLIKAGAPFIHSVDAVHFEVPAADGGAPDRLLVEFPRACELEPWQLQYLKSAAQLLTVIRQGDRAPAHAQEKLDVPSGWKPVVARCLNGRLVKGFCDDFSPTTGQLQICPTPNGPRESRVTVSLKELKAVFFVHDLAGGAARQGPENPREAGRRVEVTFLDGERLTGSTLSYSRDGAGFFVYPVDAHSNNSRTFVVAAAARRVQFP
jgi:hypothetical protein